MGVGFELALTSIQQAQLAMRHLMRAPNTLGIVSNVWQREEGYMHQILAEAQSLAFYPAPYTASPSFAMLRTP